MARSYALRAVTATACLLLGVTGAIQKHRLPASLCLVQLGAASQLRGGEMLASSLGGGGNFTGGRMAMLQLQSHSHRQAKTEKALMDAVKERVRMEVREQIQKQMADAVNEKRLATEAESHSHRVHLKSTSVAGLVTFLDRSVEMATDYSVHAFNLVQETHTKYPNFEAFSLASVLMLVIVVGFGTCWGEVERLAMHKAPP